MQIKKKKKIVPKIPVQLITPRSLCLFKLRVLITLVLVHGPTGGAGGTGGGLSLCCNHQQLPSPGRIRALLPWPHSDFGNAELAKLPGLAC